MNQILQIEPHNIEALFMRWQANLALKDVIKSKIDESLLVRILSSKGIKINHEAKYHVPLLKMRADSFYQRDNHYSSEHDNS
jgi:hypothetical protein